MLCETVRVVSPVSDGNPLGFIVINMSDITEEHELFVEPEAEPAANEGDEQPTKKSGK